MRDIDWTRTKLLAEIDRLRAELAEQRRSERFLREHSAMVEANEALRAELAARNGCETCDGERQFNRAEHAEAENTRLRAELAEWRESALELDRKLVKREAAIAKLDTTCRSQQRFNVELVAQQQALKAAIARVQELCDERDESARSVYTASWVFVSDVLAAIEGNQP